METWQIIFYYDSMLLDIEERVWRNDKVVLLWPGGHWFFFFFKKKKLASLLAGIRLRTYINPSPDPAMVGVLYTGFAFYSMLLDKNFDFQ